MNKVVIAIDSFKGSLSTFQAGRAIEEGIKEVYKNAQTIISPIADGGEGTVDAIISATNGEMVEVTVCNPIGKKIQGSYGIIPETKTAVIEMSAAAGITLIKDEERNPLHTTTYGVGEMIMDAISKGVSSPMKTPLFWHRAVLSGRIYSSTGFGLMIWTTL